MYEKIMNGGTGKFFELLDIIFPGNRRPEDSMNSFPAIDTPESYDDNEWMQEYYLIYNSYVLEGRDSDSEV